MGFLSKIIKGVKNIFKGVKKVVSKVWKGVKKFAKSKVGKIVLAGAAIYFGGAALGAWGGGGTAATSAASTASQLAASTVPTAASGVGVGAGAAASTAAASTAAGAASTGGLISQVAAAGKGALSWMSANPALTIAGGQLAQSVFAPSAAQEYGEMEDERRKRSNIAGVNYDGTGTPIDLGLVRQAQRQDLHDPTYSSTVPRRG